MSEFNGGDYEFAAGAIKGLRSWRADDQGRLRGVTHAAVWLPGENVSACKKEQRVPCEARRQSTESSRSRVCPCGCGLSVQDLMVEAPRDGCGAEGCDGHTHPHPQPHSFDPDCGCGFWAYDEHSFSEHGDVVGVIEGYGRTTIGTKGFRCEKARIVALCREREKDYMSLSLWLRLQQLYPAAKFYEELDDMVTAHGAVMRSWGPVGDDFWTPDDTPLDSSWGTLTVNTGSFVHQLRQAAMPFLPMQSPPSKKQRRWLP